MGALIDKLKGFFGSQSNHSSVLLLICVVFSAKGAGFDLLGLVNWGTEVLGAIAAFSAAMKIALPDAPTIPPSSTVITPPEPK